MALTIWKRHSATCLKTAPLQKLKIEDRRLYKKCRCACWVTGNHPTTKQYLKQSLDTTSWEAAEALVLQMHTSTPDQIEKAKIKIVDAFEAWFNDKRKLRHVSEITLDTMYTSLRDMVLEFAKDKGIALLSQLNKDAVYTLVMSPEWHEWMPSTRDRQFSNLHGFFKFAVKRDWIDADPTDPISYVKSRHEPVDPYSTEEQARLEVAFGNWTEQARSNGGQWSLHPRTLHCLKHVLDDTGLRISDAQRVRPAIITELPNGHGVCTLLQTKSDSDCAKSDGEVTVYLKPETLAKMKQVTWISAKYPFMLDCEQREDETKKEYRERFKRHLTEEGRKIYWAMQAIGKVADVADCRPHRFRHTFAVNLLESGWEIGEVSRLLGHKNINTTQKYYEKWNTRRQELLGQKVIDRREAVSNVLRMPQGDARKVG
jgi:site-specific recombinase XerD